MQRVYESENIIAYLKKFDGVNYIYFIDVKGTGQRYTTIGKEMTKADWQKWEKDTLILPEEENENTT